MAGYLCGMFILCHYELFCDNITKPSIATWSFIFSCGPGNKVMLIMQFSS